MLMNQRVIQKRIKKMDADLFFIIFVGLILVFVYVFYEAAKMSHNAKVRTLKRKNKNRDR